MEKELTEKDLSAICKDQAAQIELLHKKVRIFHLLQYLDIFSHECQLIIWCDDAVGAMQVH